MCAGLRLARFNAQLGIPDAPAYAYNFFSGVPAPAGAGLALLPLCAVFELDWQFFRSPYLCAATTVVTAALMVSQMPTFSGKRLRVPAVYAAPLLIGVAILGGFLTTEPWLTLLVIGFVYIGSFPFSIRSFRKLREAAEEMLAFAAMPRRLPCGTFGQGWKTVVKRSYCVRTISATLNKAAASTGRNSGPISQFRGPSHTEHPLIALGFADREGTMRTGKTGTPLCWI